MLQDVTITIPSLATIRLGKAIIFGTILLYISISLDGPRFCNHGQHRLRARDMAHARFKPKKIILTKLTLLKLSLIGLFTFLTFDNWYEFYGRFGILSECNPIIFSICTRVA